MPAFLNADQGQLHKLLLGQLPSAEVERLAAEYADDGRLAELAESLAGKGDALLDLLHHHETAVVDPEGERLVERLLERLKPVLPAKPRDDTAAMRLADASTEPSALDLTAPPPKLPERLEHYRPIKVLGQGGMGTVYLAEDTRLGREVAIKTLRPELAINPQAKERFLREARSAAKLEHDHIIPIYSVGEAADGTPFLAMPLLKGEPLDALIRRTSGPQPVAMVVRLAREVALGLAAAHARGLIHRDIKPANIWLETRIGEPEGVSPRTDVATDTESHVRGLTPSGSPMTRVKILDFGLAKAADAGSSTESDTNLTASGAIVGTPAYMAPEQASGEPVDGRADLFSLGCVLYELLAGQRAFSGPNTMSILMSLANHTPTAPDKLSPQCPPALSRLVMQLLEKDPANRPATAEAVIQALVELEAPTAAGGWALLPVIPNTTGKSAHPPSPTLSESPASTGSPSHIEHTQPTTPLPSRRTRESSDRSLTTSATDAPRPSESHLTLPATEVYPVRRRAIPKLRVALALAGGLLMLLAGVVYRILTDQGTLVVTIDDPAVQAILEQDGLVIRDKHSDRTWTIKATESKPLPSGEYQLKLGQQLLVTDDSGAELKTDTFALKRNGEFRVRVTLEQAGNVAKEGTTKSATMPTTTDANRRIARWVLDNGGAVRLSVGVQGVDLLGPEAELPDEKFAVITVDLGRPEIGDIAIERLAELPSLASLKLNSSFTDASLAKLSLLPNLTSLGLYGTSQITHAGLLHLRKATKLTNLALDGVQITDVGLAIIGSLKLSSLGLDHITELSPNGLKHLLKLEQLTVLTIGESGLTDAGLEVLSHMPRLEVLSLNGTFVTGAGLVHLKSLLDLRGLYLYVDFTDGDLELVKALKNLTYLVIHNRGGGRVTADGIAALHAALPGCKIEVADHCAKTGAALESELF